MTPRRLTPALLTLLAATFGFTAQARAAGTDDEGRLITRNTDGAWFLQQPEGSPGKGCVARFTSAKKDQSQLALIGPTAKSATAAILMHGPRIATPPAAQEVTLELQQDGLPPATMRGALMPAGGAKGGGFLMVPVGDLKQTMGSMRPKETGMKVRVGGVDVFGLSYDGLDQARSAMLDCLAGKPYTGGKSLVEATAEIRLVGTGAIAGTAFYKGALLAKKQYPPKGSQRVGLIHMSDEFKQWFETVKQSQKMPDRIPERIAKHFMFATILDDQGSFRFTRLPPGEYLLIADFSYTETVTRSEVTGRTDVFVGNQHIGSNDQVAYWFEDVKKTTTFSKTVHLKDGETLQVTLDKSMLGCFFICR
ncbi:MULTISPECIES: carboxypeptidase-like regulatory domain-containing protein [unclassified Pseudoxanthomonas]|uniref:carboxypeptidase-like regulatory domain-containing protein n=1 Tax=unclassified Pseudoxanthomonas TaxID=2645906 RepID=UPI00307DEC9E